MLPFLIGSCCSGMALAGERITFALFTREWPPFEMVIDGEPRGAAVDLFRACMPGGSETAVEMMPAPRSVLHKPGKPVYTRLECRNWMGDADKYLWSDPVVTVQTVLYSPSGKPVEFDGESSLHGLTIGCIRNYSYPDVQSAFDSGKAERYDVNDEVLLLRMLKAGRVDAAIFDDVSAAWMIHGASDMEHRDFYVSTRALGSADLRFVFNLDPDLEALLPEINARIHEKREDGTIKSIMSRYR